MDTRQQLEYLQALGIKTWLPKDMELQPEKEEAASPTPAPEPQAAPESIPESKSESVSEVATELAPEIELSSSPVDVSLLGWEALEDCVKDCTACSLHASRTQSVFGVGNQQADLLVIGEAPGAEEDQQGEPFIGRAGQLLNEMLLAINRPRHEVYIANIVKCRPPENRNPQADEALQCAAYLKRQIELIAPAAILAVGKVAAQNLLQTDLPIGKMRGNQYHYAALNIPVFVTYHPAYLLRSPKEKRKVWDDLKQVKSLLAS